MTKRSKLAPLTVPTFKTTSTERFEIQTDATGFVRVISTRTGEMVMGTLKLAKAEAWVANPPAGETR